MAKRKYPFLSIWVVMGILLIVNFLTGVVWSSDADDAYMSEYIGADADYIGSDTCLMCHSVKKPENLFTHVAMFDNDAKNPNYGYGCEACHGPGSKHMGNKKGIINPAKFSPEGITETCSKCHESLKSFDLQGWYLSEHNSSDLSCLQCHQGHSEYDAFLLYEDKTELCYSCHAGKRAEFSMRSHHPLKEGNIACMDCHNPHSGKYDNQLVADTPDLCYSCHMDKKGPFVFDHDTAMYAGSDGCMTCHNVHGANSDSLLKYPSNRVCLQCHTDRQPEDHFAGSCWTSGCHSNIHGSNSNPLFFE